MKIKKVKDNETSNNKYQVTISKMIYGQLHEIRKDGFTSKKDAQRWGEEQERHLLMYGYFFEVCELSFEEVFKEWISLYERGYSKSRISSFKTSFKKIDETIKKKRFTNITLSDLQESLNNISPNSYKPTLKTLFNHLYKYAIESNYINRNLATGLKYKAEPRQENKNNLISYEDMMKIVYTLREENKLYLYSYSMIILIGYYTGMRISEILALTKEDIDLENNIIIVNKQLDRHASKKGKPVIKEPKYNTMGVLPLVEPLKQELIEWYKINNQDLICFNSKNNYVSYNTLRTVIKKRCDQLGLEDFHFHALRHTMASNVYNETLDIKLTGDLLRDKSIDIVTNTYTHYNGDSKSQLNEVFEKVVKK